MLRIVPFASINTLGAFDPFFDADHVFASDSLKAYEIEMDMPGFKKEDSHLDVENGFLKVTAERRASSEEKDKDGGVLRSERLFGSFSRSFDLAGVQEADITASYDGGVLKLVLPKKEETLPASRRVEIQ